MLSSYGHSFVSVQKLATGSLPAEDKQAWINEQKMFQNNDWAMVYFPPRGIGPTAWNPAPFKQNQHQRRFYLLGQTLDGMRCWDVRRAIQAIRPEASAPVPQAVPLLAIDPAIFRPRLRR